MEELAATSFRFIVQSGIHFKNALTYGMVSAWVRMAFELGSKAGDPSNRLIRFRAFSWSRLKTAPSMVEPKRVISA